MVRLGVQNPRGVRLGCREVLSLRIVDETLTSKVLPGGAIKCPDPRPTQSGLTPLLMFTHDDTEDFVGLWVDFGEMYHFIM